MPHTTLALFDPAEGLSGSWDMPPGSDFQNPGSQVAGATYHFARFDPAERLSGSWDMPPGQARAVSNTGCGFSWIN